MKKTLLIDARVGGDFTIDALWAGLVDRLGHESVIDFPPAAKHRAGIPQITGNVEKDYGAERMSLCYTSYHDSFKSYAHQDINRLIALNEIERIFIDERDESYLLYCMTTARFSKIPVVVVAGHDRFWNKSPETLRDMYGNNLEALFIDNWRENYRSLKNTYPMSYSTNFDHLWNVSEREELLKNKVYDICFMGYNSHGDRAVIVEHLLSKYGEKGNCLLIEKRPNIMDTFIRKSEYFKKMAQSRICINLKGAAECGKALRFYEIPYVGSYMISQVDSANQVYPFRGGEHCDYFDGLGELDYKIKFALENTSRREYIANSGHSHAMKYHTARARVDYIYERLGN